MKAQSVAGLPLLHQDSNPKPECPRCQGMLIPTLLQVGPYDATVPSFPNAWRCINCGALLDGQIILNRSSIPENSQISGHGAPRKKARRPRGGPRVRFPIAPKR